MIFITYPFKNSFDHNTFQMIETQILYSVKKVYIFYLLLLILIYSNKTVLRMHHYFLCFTFYVKYAKKLLLKFLNNIFFNNVKGLWIFQFHFRTSSSCLLDYNIF